MKMGGHLLFYLINKKYTLYFMLSKINAFTKVALGSDVSTQELKTLIRALSIRDLHKPYEYILGRVDPSLDLSYARGAVNKKFIFEGRGHNTLKPYRIMDQQSGKAFEKIFFNDTEDLQANRYFYQNLKSLLGDAKIKVPACLKTIKGKKFTILLFEFLELKSIPKGQEYEVLSAKTLDLYYNAPKRGKAENICFDKYLFGKNRLMDKKILSLYDIAKVEQIMQQAPVYFQHLDLMKTMFFQMIRLSIGIIPDITLWEWTLEDYC